MNNRKPFLIIVALFIIVAGCSNNSPPQLSHLQIVSMVPTQDALISIQPINGTGDFYQSINYAEPSGYHQFKPGRYQVRYSVDGTTVLDHTYVLGKNSHQTLLIAGILPDSLRINPQTFWFTAGKILAGSESSSPNGYMPQYIMLRDGYGGGKTKGAVRFVNASPLAQKIYAKSVTAGFKHKVAYPQETEPLTVKLNPFPIHFRIGKIALDSLTLTPKKGYVHTVIIGNSAHADSSLKFARYDTPLGD